MVFHPRPAPSPTSASGSGVGPRAHSGLQSSFPRGQVGVGAGPGTSPQTCETAAWGPQICHTMQPRLRILVILKTIYCKEPWTVCCAAETPSHPSQGEKRTPATHTTVLATPAARRLPCGDPSRAEAGGGAHTAAAAEPWGLGKAGCPAGTPRKGCRCKAGLGPGLASARCTVGGRRAAQIQTLVVIPPVLAARLSWVHEKPS